MRCSTVSGKKTGRPPANRAGNAMPMFEEFDETRLNNGWVWAADTGGVARRGEEGSLGRRRFLFPDVSRGTKRFPSSPPALR